MKSFPYHSSKDSFTLVELLVVIGILAILTAAVVIVLNPAELLKQSRDSKRVTDLASIDRALALLVTQSPDVNLGTASTVYVSVADPALAAGATSACPSMGLPILPAGYAYRCVSSANLTKTDGTGWIPVNLAATGVSNLPALPIDPTNQASSGSYYMFAASTNWHIAAAFESKKYKMGGGADRTANDGGAFPDLYEKGSNLGLLPIDYGDKSLLGYYPLDEASGAQAVDYSGKNHEGWMYSSSTNAFLGTTANCKTGGCLSFDGVDDSMRITSIPASDFNTIHGPSTISLWFRPSVVPVASSKYVFSDYCTEWGVYQNASSVLGIAYPSVDGGAVQANTWYHAVVTHEHPSGLSNTVVKLYVNGVLKNSNVFSVTTQNGYVNDPPFTLGLDTCTANSAFAGLVDQVRIYNRALSAEEVQALYNSAR